jgi:hypothetical protein
VRAPRDGGAAGITVAELGCSAAGTVTVRGAMVPRSPFPPGIARTPAPHFKIGPGGAVDTGCACRTDAATGATTIVGPPLGMVGIGGYRFPLSQLQNVVARVDADAVLEAHRDPLLGRHLVGDGANRPAMRAALEGLGINPLVVAAFADRGESATAADQDGPL